ncbi:MAG: Bax inhibitor-1/YccA family protein [Gammaproteobacteria bacterium]
MNEPIVTTARRESAAVGLAPEAVKVLRNTYALLAMSVLFSAGTAAVSVSMKLPHPGLLLTLVGYFGLLFAIHKFKNSAAGIALVFALTGFMGLTLGPLLSSVLALPGGGATVMNALGLTGLVFLGASGYVLTTRKDLSWMGTTLFAGVLVAFAAALAAWFFEMPALSLAVSALFAILMSAMIAWETSAIIHGGERNYVLATVGLFVSLFNLFASLLHLLGIAGGDE